MANASIRFSFDAPGTQEAIDKLAEVAREARVALHRIDLAKSKKRLHRAYLNMLRSTRRTRKHAVRRWELVKLHVRAAEIRAECPNAEVRIVSRNLRKGEPIVVINAIYARGSVQPSGVDRRTILLGHRPIFAAIDDMNPATATGDRLRDIARLYGIEP
jgi:hypothetical protein